MPFIEDKLVVLAKIAETTEKLIVVLHKVGYAKLFKFQYLLLSVTVSSLSA